MKWCRIETAEGPSFGVVEGETVALVDGTPFDGFNRTGRTARCTTSTLPTRFSIRAPSSAKYSRYNTLSPGDVIWLATDDKPENLKPSDVIEIEITGIGVLRNRVVAETP